MTLIDSDRLPVLEEGTKTVSTAGTPVQLTSIKGKKAYIQSVEANNDKRIVVGTSAVDALTSPPAGARVLYATQAEVFEQTDTSELYIDSDQNDASVHYRIYG